MYLNIELFFFIFARVIGFIVLMPILSGINIPIIVKLIFSITISFNILFSNIITTSYYSSNFFEYLIIFLKEFSIGLMIAFCAYTIFSSLYFMGQLLDFQLGFSMASVFDPISQAQMPITGNLFNFFITLLFIQARGIDNIIIVIYNSFKDIKVDAKNILLDGHIINFIIDLTSQIIIIGFKFALPVMSSMFIIDVTLGILIKAVPQINVFVVGMPLKLLIGMYVLLFMGPIIIEFYEYIFQESYIKMIDITKGLAR